MDNERENVTENVRQYAAGNRVISRHQASLDLGYTKHKVSVAITNLVEQGWLKKIKLGQYEFQDRRLIHPTPVEDKVWRAMRINKTFSAQDIARQVGTSDSYVMKRIREYRDAGWVKRRGKKPSMHEGKKVNVWSLTVKGTSRIQKPEIDVFKADPMIEAVVKLNRLICTGRAQRNVTDRENAVKLMDDIKTKLQEAI